jgi:predicted ATP-dependent endonuclease of OLD family
MKLQAYRLQNYRRLRDVVIELDEKISIFVGANNSGKTSAVQGLYSMIQGEAKRFELFDFNAELWSNFDEIGNANANEDAPLLLPNIILDLWFRVDEDDLAVAMPLLPSSEWAGKCVGIRVKFEPNNAYELVQRFRSLRDKANAAAGATQPDAKNIHDADSYKPWPNSLTKYLKKELSKEYTFRYYLLDEQSFTNYKQKSVDYEPLPFVGETGGAATLKSLLKVDFLRAQRHLDDPGAGGSDRAESLSRRLSRFYQRNLEKRGEDHAVLKALDTSERDLNFHLKEVFSETLENLSKLGYPGINNPEIVIRAALDPTTVLGQDAEVHYVLPGDTAAHLPDSYNGLGFKNLVYMVVELLDLHEQWKANDDKRAPLHLIFIEEPEAHLHAQIQQVFIRNILRLLGDKSELAAFFHTQLVITTHSPHILYERGFSPIRYFRRVAAKLNHHTDVRNLSQFKTNKDEKVSREFLQRYLKLTHCDLFFSDALILVEGNVERLLMPAMIESSAKRLRSSALTILEVGGAFAHRFQELIEFLGLTTLIVTDLDSVLVRAETGDVDKEKTDTCEMQNSVDSAIEADEDDLKSFEVDEEASAEAVKKKLKKRGSTCHAHTDAAVTSNQTLISWIPKRQTVADLWAVRQDEKIVELVGSEGAFVRVAYQTPISVTIGGETLFRCGRTLEEAFGLENAAWCQELNNAAIGLKFKTAAKTPQELALSLHNRITGNNFDKTKFALEVLASGPVSEWRVPSYIAEGLVWLEELVAHEREADIAIFSNAAASVPADVKAITANDLAGGTA